MREDLHQPLRRNVIAIVVGLLFAAAVMLTPFREVLRNGVLDTGFAMLGKTPAEPVLVVEVDAKSLQALGSWPWQRSVHAQLLQSLSGRGIDQLVFDIDFSAPSLDPVEDQYFASALRGADMPVYLPSFRQALSSDVPQLVLTQPHSDFAPYVRTGLVDIRADADGLVRRLVHSQSNLNGHYLSLASTLNPATPLQPDVAYPLDFAYDPDMVQRVSYVDVLNNVVPDQAFDRAVVFIGTTALELGDHVVVPVYQSIPGVYLQVLAHLTMQAPLEAADPLTTVGLLFLIAFVFLLTSKLRWSQQLAMFSLQVAGIVGIAWTLQLQYQLQITVSFPLIYLFGIYLLSFVMTLDAQRVLLIGSQVSAERQAALIDSLFSGSVDGILIVDELLTIRHANQAAKELLFGGRGLVDESLSRFIPRLIDSVALKEAMRSCDDGGLARWTATIGGAECVLDVAVSELDRQEAGRYLIIVRDVTEQQHQAERLEYQASHDALTGLLNRRSLNDALTSMLDGGNVALLMVDLDRFKHINDTLGHVIGDDVLRIVARRMSEQMPAGSVVARFGGDEFCICVEDVDITAAALAAEVLLDSLRAPIAVAGVGLEVGASVGIAMAPDHAADGDGLLQKADIALYQAKTSRTGVEVFDPQINGPSVRQLQIAGALRNAIEYSKLRMNYQPKICVATGGIVGVEALVRWRDAKLGDIPPVEFVTLAEETDLIHPLTEWTLNRAVADMAELAEAGHELSCAINISARHFRDFAFASLFAELMQRESLRPGALELEITESALMDDPQLAIQVIEKLREAGATLAVDDFGTGFSSLAYLKQFQLNCLKVDKCFVDDVVDDEADEAIVRSVIMLAHDLGMTVVAEGVETAQQLDKLDRLGCDTVQGFHLSAPLELDALRRRLDADRARGEVLAWPGLKSV